MVESGLARAKKEENFNPYFSLMLKNHVHSCQVYSKDVQDLRGVFNPRWGYRPSISLILPMLATEMAC